MLGLLAPTRSATLTFEQELLLRAPLSVLQPTLLCALEVLDLDLPNLATRPRVPRIDISTLRHLTELLLRITPRVSELE